MNNYKDSILSALRNGTASKEIAEEFSKALNDAEAAFRVEEEKKKIEEAKKNTKREAMRDALFAMNSYYKVSKGKDVFNVDDLTDAAIDIICKTMDSVNVSFGSSSKDSWLEELFKFF